MLHSRFWAGFLADILVDTILKLVCTDMQETYEREEFARVAEALLGVPDEAIAREHREKLMTLLVSALRARATGGSASIEFVKPIVSLMVKLMRRPTFYPVSVPQTRGRVQTCSLRLASRTWPTPISTLLPMLLHGVRSTLQTRFFNTYPWWTNWRH